jgi:molybdenum cofactor biosynthesis enzyme MoaA
MDDFYCVAPFRQVYIDSSGVSPCCQIARKDTTLKEWEHNKFLKKIQQQTLQGQWPTECAKCRTDEQLYNTSLRIKSNTDYNDEKYTDTKIDFVDYRSENLCNFRCRSCEPAFSHLIAKEVQDNPTILSNFFPIVQKKYVNVDESNYQWILDNLGQIRRLMFTGGEPTAVPGVRLMLQQVLEKQHKDLLILITTNGSFQDDFWYDLTKKLPNLHWTISIDAVGSAASIIRDGSNWSQIEYNARWLAKNSTSFMINSVISNISLFQLWPLLDFVKDLKQQTNGINGCDHVFHVISGSNHLAAHNLNDQLKTQAIAYLTKCQEKSWESTTQLMLRNLKKQLINSKFNEFQWKQSQKYNRELDRLRGQDHTQLFVTQYPD